MGKINDLDMSNWKELTDVWTDSLWIIPQRDNSGAHDGHYHGNFVPQIPEKTPDIIYICCPNNPTGTTLKKDELQKWVDYAEYVRCIDSDIAYAEERIE